LLGYPPDYVFTHVTRLLISKGLWRDLLVVGRLDRVLASDNKTALFFILSTSLPAGRPAEDVCRWEAEYGWPVVHRRNNGDLIGHELPLYRAIKAFNAGSQAVKVVLVNHLGWAREWCGVRMPADMTFDDLRLGTHLEFGQSTYEPFGISQVEPLASGALAVVSTVSGCIGCVEQAARQAGLPYLPNLVQADYITLADGLQVYSPWDALWIDQQVRDRLEKASSHAVALAVRATLPVTDAQARALLNRGQRVAQLMSWEVVARDHFVPALQRTITGQP
jgi:hypothetical protein